MGVGLILLGLLAALTVALLYCVIEGGRHLEGARAVIAVGRVDDAGVLHESDGQEYRDGE